MASTDSTTTSATPVDPVSDKPDVGGSAVSASAPVVPGASTPSIGNAVMDQQNPQASATASQASSTVAPGVEKKEPAGPPPINFDVVPSLRGTFFPGETGGSIKGLWAMMDSQHGQEGMTSEFELHFVQGIGKMTMDAVELLSGKYKGWFRLKRLNGNGTDKIDEKNVILNFSKMKEEDGKYSIKGEGSNRFGAFVLQGTLSQDNSVIMYRQYVVKVGSAQAAAAARVTAPVGAPVPRKPQSPRPYVPKPPPTDKMMNQRDGAGRERKKSNVFSEEYLAGEDMNNPKPKGKGDGNARTQRLSQHLLRCGDLLKELNKLPTSVYFAKPVDPVALNIPDYTTLITTPMDFQTVGQKLYANEYQSPLHFAEDVRLVFKNAITYNQLKDNPVHIAAREMSMRFEEKYKGLMQSMHSKSAGSVSAAELAAFTARSNRGGPLKPKTKSSTARPAKVGGMVRGGVAAPDGSLIQMQEMQRKMMEMQRELSTLRGAVPGGAADKQLAPLTYLEKKSLIDSINEMPSEHMERVIVIVQEATRATASGDGDEDIEIPLDELDTGTLRKLQRLVNEVMPGKKRQAPASDAGDIPPAKRQAQRKSGGFEGVYQPSSVKVEHATGAPAAPTIEAPTEDYADFFNADMGGSTVVAANTDAWATSSAQVTQPTGERGAGAVGAGGAWGAASAEMQAKREREQQQRLQEEKLQQQRKLEEQQRAEALSNAVKKQHEESQLAAKKAEQDAAKAEQELQRRREEERIQREGMRASVTVDSSDLLKQMEADV